MRAKVRNFWWRNLGSLREPASTDFLRPASRASHGEKEKHGERHGKKRKKRKKEVDNWAIKWY